MTLKLRRVKKYNQRRSSKMIRINKQKLRDLEHIIRADMGELLVFLQEGAGPNAKTLSQKTRSNLLKFGPEMQKIADEIGGAFPKKVAVFLAGIDSLLLSAKEDTGSDFRLWADPNKIDICFKATRSLEQALLK